jgi:PatG C-terminal/PatG Domain
MAERTSTPETEQAAASALSSPGTSSEARPRRGVPAARGKPVGRVTPLQDDLTVPEEEPESEEDAEVANDVEEEEEMVQESGQRMASWNGPASRQPSKAKRTTPARATDRAVAPAACACESPNGQPQFVFALGTLGIDFGTEIRRDYFLSHFGHRIPTIMDPRGEGVFDVLSEIFAVDVEARQPGTPPPPAPPQTVTVTQAVRTNQSLAEKIIWTLNHDATPIYAIQPKSAFAHLTYDLLIGMLADQVNEMREAREKAAREKKEVEERQQCVSIAGTFGGKVTLLTGQVVPVIYPDVRGMFNWRIKELIASLTEGLDEENAALLRVRIDRIFTRFYYDFRNLGVTPQERALNYSVTIGTNMVRAFGELRKQEEATEFKKRFELDDVQVVRSPICRPDSDCWDVKLTFFDQEAPWGSMRFVVHFAVDVNDAMPVAIGPPRYWYLR